MLSASLICTTIAAAAPIATEEQAIERAKQFFAKVGWKASTQPGAQFPGEKPWEHCWDVRQYCSDRRQTSFEANVDKATGQIHGAFRHEAYGEPSDSEKRIDKSRASALALEYLRAAGLPVSETRLQRAEIANGAWDLRYGRVYRSYPYRLDCVDVLIRPSDGTLKALGYHFKSPLPESTRVAVSRDKASSIAREHLLQWTDDPGQLSSTKLMIVQPNDYYEGLDVREPMESRNVSRLAWVADLEPPRSHLAEVWVDAESGDVLGGMTCLCGIPRRCYPAVDRATSGTVHPTGGKDIPLSVSDRLSILELVKRNYGRLRSDAASADYASYLELRDASRSYRFGYSQTQHRLDLLEKKYVGGTIKTKLCWDTSTEVEQRLARYLSRDNE